MVGRGEPARGEAQPGGAARPRAYHLGPVPHRAARHALLVSLALLAAAGPRLARAEDPAPASPAEPPAATSPPPSAEALRPAPPATFDFDLLPAAPAGAAATDPAFERAVGRRRTMLKVHQGLGLGMLTALAATTVVGQLDFNDRFRGMDTGRYHTLHKGLAYGSAAVFATAAAFSLLAPEPYAKRTRSGLDSARVHKIAMGVAAAAMVAQVILGATARGEAGTLRERDLATAHQVLGYATLGAATAGAVVLLF